MAKTIFARKNGNSQNTLPYDELKEIEKIAYQYYVERGYQNGYDQEDWLRAESVVKSRKS